MSNLKIRDKIVKLGKRYGLSPSAMLLLESMIAKSDNTELRNGGLNKYQVHEPYFVGLFKGGINEYYAAYQELLSGKFIEHNKVEDRVSIRPFLSPYFYSILGVIEGRKRQYIKSLETAKNDHDALLKKYSSKMDYDPGHSDDQLFRYNTKTNGVKIPEYLHPYFSGEPLSMDDVKAVSRIDSNYLRLETDRRSLSKEEKRVYYACMRFADTNGVIDDYNERSLISSIIIEFGDGSVCQATVYLAVKKLLELGLIRVDVNDKIGRCYLVVVGYKEAFERKERYVIIPDVVLEKAFKKCQTSTIKAFFKIMFMLNNGDGGEGSNSGQNKSIRLSFEKFLPGRSKIQNDEREDWLKKRYPGEVCSIVWGDIDAYDINSLAYFFHIVPDNKEGKLSYYFRIRSKYYISKKSNLFKSYLALTGKNKRRAQIIEESFRKHGYECSQEDLRDLVKIFRGAGSKNICSVIGQLMERVRAGKENGWPDIRSIPAFVHTLYRNGRYKPDILSAAPDPVTS